MERLKQRNKKMNLHGNQSVKKRINTATMRCRMMEITLPIRVDALMYVSIAVLRGRNTVVPTYGNGGLFQQGNRDLVLWVIAAVMIRGNRPFIQALFIHLNIQFNEQ